MKYKFIALLSLVALLFVGCAEQNTVPSNTIFVSIAPLKPLIEGIVGDSFEVKVLVPQGASPETFEPSPKQLREVEKSRLLFSTGLLDFESNLIARIAKREQVIELHHGIKLIAGTCSHAGHCGHSHGIDPHIWCSPKSIAQMADNAYKAILQAMPDSVAYSNNYNELCVKILDLNEEITEICRIASRTSFIIYHPALTYLARDYSLQQIAIENEGKEPSARRLGEVIDIARREGITKILYQSEFPVSSVEVICQDTGGKAVEINPLAEDIFTNIRNIVTTITE